MAYCSAFRAVLFVGGFAFPTLKDDGNVLHEDMSKYFDQVDSNVGRIVGGSVAAEGSYPWMVAIVNGFTTPIFICGGAIITNRHVLTAAHCIDALMSSGQSINVIVGTNNWNYSNSSSYGSRMVARNPEYDPITKKNDIGIIFTISQIVLNNRVRTINISYDFVSGGVPVTVSGWGWLQTGGTLSDVLHESRVLTFDGESCVAEVRQVAQSIGLHVPRVNPDLEICTFLTGNQGICVGDGGSPLVRNSNNHLIGVASWGVPCARGAPDVFTRVSVQRTWIQAVLNIPL